MYLVVRNFGTIGKFFGGEKKKRGNMIVGVTHLDPSPLFTRLLVIFNSFRMNANFEV